MLQEMDQQIQEMAGALKDAESAERQDTEPVVQKHEEEDRDGDRKDFLGHLAAAGDLVCKIQSSFENDFEEMLELAGNFFHLRAERKREHNDDEHRHPARDERVGDRKAMHIGDGLCVERAFVIDLFRCCWFHDVLFFRLALYRLQIFFCFTHNAV